MRIKSKRKYGSDGSFNESDGMSNSILSSDDEKQAYEKMKVAGYNADDVGLSIPTAEETTQSSSRGGWKEDK